MRLYFLNAVIVDCTAGSCINLQYCTLGLSKRVVCIYYTGTISYVAHHSIGDLRLQCFHFPRILFLRPDLSVFAQLQPANV